MEPVPYFTWPNISPIRSQPATTMPGPERRDAPPRRRRFFLGIPRFANHRANNTPHAAAPRIEAPLEGRGAWQDAEATTAMLEREVDNLRAELTTLIDALNGQFRTADARTVASEETLPSYHTALGGHRLLSIETQRVLTMHR